MKLSLATATAIVVGLAVPASSFSATLTTDRSCYREGAKVLLTGLGFTPAGSASISLDGQQLTSPTEPQPVGPNPTFPGYPPGGFFGVLTLASIPDRERSRTLVATDTTNPALTASAVFKQVKVIATTRPLTLKPGEFLRVTAKGFYGGGRLFAHVRGPGSAKRNVRLGRVKGPCGRSAGRGKLLRRGDPTGIYRIQYDTRRKYKASTRPAFRTAYQIRRVLRRSSTSGVAAASAATIATQR